MTTTGLRRRVALGATMGLGAVAMLGVSDAGAETASHHGYLTANLIGVTVAPHSADAWAVGARNKRTGGGQNYALHRVGAKWKPIALDQPNAVQIVAVAAGSPHSIWAVGDVNDGTGANPVIEHSTGGAFKRLTVSIGSGNLFSASASSPTNAWAVGGPPYGGVIPIAAHWDGHTWQGVDDTIQKHDNVTSVSTTGANNAWLLGYTLHHADAAFWNGKTLTDKPIPVKHSDALAAIATAGPKDTWVVGWRHTRRGLNSLTFHWNGTSWKQVPAPSPGYNATLAGVAMAGKKVYATGISVDSSETKSHSYLLRFVGGHWKPVSTPRRGAQSSFVAIAVSSKAAAAVGEYSSTTSKGELTELPFAATLQGGKWKTEPAAY